MLDRLRRLLFRRPDDAFDDEIREHIALLTDRYIRQGMNPADAEGAARRQFGNQTSLKEIRSEMQTFAPIENLARDLRYGLRVIARAPGFAAVAFLTLALGIGVNTAIFSVVEAVLLRPLPYPYPERIVVPATVFLRYGNDTGSVSYADIRDWKADRDTFDSVSALMQSDVDVTGGEQPERVRGIAADEEYFRVIGGPLHLGRAPTADDNRPGADRVVVLAFNFWMRRFGGDPSTVGSTVELNGRPTRIIGVANKNAFWPSTVELLRPLVVDGFSQEDLSRRDNHIFRVIARLRPGVPFDAAQAKVAAMGARLAQETSRRATGLKLHLLRDFVVGSTLRQTLVILMGASLVVLLIACVNVANLLLARGAARAREVAIRNALGAGWKRVAAQFLAESAILSAAGGLAGVAVGYWTLKALLRFAPTRIPLLDQTRLDGGALAFTGLLCLVAALVAGVGPAIQAARRAPGAAFQDTSRSASTGVRGSRVRAVLVVAQMSLALVLLAGAGLLVRSFRQIQRVDAGFPTRNLLTLRVALPATRYGGEDKTIAGFSEIAAAIRRAPGVVNAAGVGSLPIDGGGFYLGRVFLREGQPEPPASNDAPALWNPVMPGAFDTLGIRLVRGRAFSDRDAKGSTPVIIVSERLAKEMFPGQDPIGRRIRSWRDENVYREIVGVVADVYYGFFTERLGNAVYIPHSQSAWGALQFGIRTTGDPAAVLPSVRAAIWSVDKKLTISQVITMDEIVETGMSRPRFTMFLLGAFGATALLLAAIGIYGVVAYGVQQRTREIGIRIALGAARRDVLRMVARGALALAAAGVSVGLAGALAVTRLMTTLLYGVSPTDLATFLAVAGILIAVTVVAAFVPARRASRVDPIVTLRYE